MYVHCTHLTLLGCYVRARTNQLTTATRFLCFFQVWNIFDTIIVVANVVTLFVYKSDWVIMLRLLRLLLIFEKLKKYPHLLLPMTTLILSAKLLIFAMLIIAVMIFVYARIGVEFFQADDPWHFGNLHKAMVTLFRCITLDDWQVTPSI